MDNNDSGNKIEKNAKLKIAKAKLKVVESSTSSGCNTAPNSLNLSAVTTMVFCTPFILFK